MNINLTFDQPINTLPSGFVASLNAVAQFLDSQFNNPITINIDVGYGEIDGQPLDSGALGESETFLNEYSYAAIRGALIANASSTDQVSAVNSLPASDPTPGGSGNYWVATAESKAIGLSGPSSATDGFIGFANQGVTFTYNTTNGGPVAPGTYDFFAVAAHEITEVLGRDLLVGGTVFTSNGNVTNSYEPLDLFHYASSTHKPLFSGTTAGYFSPDGGATNLDSFNTNRNGDFGDWAGSAGNDSFLAFSPAGVANPVTSADLREMNVLGYDLPAPAPTGFVGDFNADTHSDLLWQASNGHPTEWLMNGTAITTSQSLVNPGSSWRVIATGDFNLDGNSDLLWQNTDGRPAIWEMNGASILMSAGLANPGTSWKEIATGDFDADGKSDILWQNTDGRPAIWEMNGLSIKNSGALVNPGPSWHAITTGDFNADGKADILWQNTDGQPSIWEMNGLSLVSHPALTNPGATWHPVATADFNGDGNADIIWQNVDGTPAIWLMNGTTPTAEPRLSNPGASWELIGAGNYNASHPDLVFLNTQTDQVQIWVMNGTNVQSMQTVATTAPSTANPSAASAPLSSGPVLSEPDAYYAGLPGGAPLLGGNETPLQTSMAGPGSLPGRTLFTGT
jgi:VCBS repeat protein